MAVTITKAELASELGINTANNTRFDRLFEVASELVSEYVRGSTVPGSVCNEALVRCLGWLMHRHGQAGGLKRQRVDDLEVEYFSGGFMSALKQSGAESLLSSFKERRAV